MEGKVDALKATASGLATEPEGLAATQSTRLHHGYLYEGFTQSSQNHDLQSKMKYRYMVLKGLMVSIGWYVGCLEGQF